MALVFICYSHADHDLHDELVEHLRNLDHLGIEAWSDRRIAAGTNWRPAIERAIEASDAAILMISAKFLNSRFITEVEVPRLLQLRQERGLRVFPLIAAPCNWQTKPWLAQIQSRPWEGKPMSGRSRTARAAALAALALEVLEATGLREKPVPVADGTRQTIELKLQVDYDPKDRASLDAIERALRTATGDDQLKILRAAPGSLRLFVELPPEALRQLQRALAQGFMLPLGVQITSTHAEVEIVQLRGQPVLLDEALALFFERETKHINQARDRNADRFGPDYAFQLTGEEWSALQSQFVTAKPGRGGRRTPPWAYTELGASMMATVLRSPRAVAAAKLVVETFVAARRQARAVPPGNHDGVGDPSADTPDKQAFKRRMAGFDAKPDPD